MKNTTQRSLYKPDPVNPQKAENHLILCDFFLGPRKLFLIENRPVLWYTIHSDFRKARRQCDGSDLYRGTTEQDEQQGYALPAQDHDAASAKTGRNAAKAGNTDPAAGRAEIGTGILERHAV